MSKNPPIVYFNRHSGREEQEQVLGERSLRFIYSNPLGKLALHALLKRAFFSKIYGKIMSSPDSRRQITRFVEDFKINMEESVKSLEEFTSFNDFFYRQLVPGARPITPNPQEAIFPSDGRHMGFPDVAQCAGIFVKGQSFDLEALLGSKELAEKFKHGTLIISRLCPTDYHRFHFPISGTPSETKLIKGPLASVSPYALRHRASWLWTNKRTLTRLQSEQWGEVLLIDVGATCVGSIFQTFVPGQAIQKGDEKGYFAFGGSTVITLFEPNRIKLTDDLLAYSAKHQELYAQMGSPMGSALKKSQS